MSKRIRMSCNTVPERDCIDIHLDPSCASVCVEENMYIACVDLTKENAILLAESILEYYKGE